MQMYEDHNAMPMHTNHEPKITENLLRFMEMHGAQCKAVTINENYQNQLNIKIYLFKRTFIKENHKNVKF